MEILRYSDLVEIPWKNGGGVTRDIAKATCNGEFVWRISRADVSQEGPFSDFAGLVRILTVVSDSGMQLEHASGVSEAKPWVPVQFDGALKVSSRLDTGPLTDLNLMFDPRFCSGDVQTLQTPLQEHLACDAKNVFVLHCLSGTPMFGPAVLGIGDTAVISESEGELELKEGDAVLKISLTYVGGLASIMHSIAH